MTQDRSDVIRTLVLKQRIDKFVKYLSKKRSNSNCAASGSGSAWNNAYAQALDDVWERSRDIFGGKEDKPVKLD